MPNSTFFGFMFSYFSIAYALLWETFSEVRLLADDDVGFLSFLIALVTTSVCGCLFGKPRDLS